MCEGAHTGVRGAAILKAKLHSLAEYRMPYQIAFDKHPGAFIRSGTIFLLRRKPVSRAALLNLSRPLFFKDSIGRKHESSFILALLYKAAIGCAVWPSPDELSSGSDLAMAPLESKAAYADACE